ncbi:dihydrofolate reductase family protein [Actinocrispum wychmicini]|uniref:Dihydrofolate reductase n=1 Tax=Actinocrispum wychmicini TaxID=1213861 RepID=A0A4R2ILG3_9PSEU|nr:dihydrofolate reductase family protein [Actinocrispum wychmicini]TCO45342.1 dihydrofolate reductase [Actinocrispum wychmicini]
MGRIIVSANVSLDGVIQDPTGEEGLGRGNWFGRIADQDRAEWAKAETEEAMAAEGLLMGRRSYAWFVKRGWPSRTGEWADRLRSLPKYVVSSAALEGPEWTNSTALTGDVVTEVSKLRQQVTGDIVVYGSGRLVHTLTEHDLVDELRLMTYPFVVGAGERLFGETSAVKPMRLMTTRTIGDGIAFLTYQPVRDA